MPVLVALTRFCGLVRLRHGQDVRQVRVPLDVNHAATGSVVPPLRLVLRLRPRPATNSLRRDERRRIAVRTQARHLFVRHLRHHVRRIFPQQAVPDGRGQVVTIHSHARLLLRQPLVAHLPRLVDLIPPFILCVGVGGLVGVHGKTLL